MSEYGTRAARAAAEPVRGADRDGPPDLAVILGSGLGALADQLGAASQFRYADLPGYPPPTVAGHGGRLVVGQLGRRRVLAFDGRTHEYENAGLGASAFAVRVAHALGVRTLFVTNAAGSLRGSPAPGDLMVIRDHINFTFRNPLSGPPEEGEQRFPDMSSPYDPEMTEALLSAARAVSPRTTAGVYAGVLGPSYETPAEVRALARLGADAVGMSTVSEVIVARALGMRVAGVSLITNLAGKLTHAEVLDASRRATVQLVLVLSRFVGWLPAK